MGMSLPLQAAARGEWHDADSKDMGATRVRAKRGRLAVPALLAAGQRLARNPWPWCTRMQCEEIAMSGGSVAAKPF